MILVLEILLGLALAAGIAALLMIPIRRYRTYRGTRVITCPETHAPAAVHVAALKAALAGGPDGKEIELKDCSRWPERQACGQECLMEIEAGPGDCLLRTIVTQWYDDKQCLFCGKPLDDVSPHHHLPGVMGPDRKIRQWSEFPPEKLPGVFATHQPVCWDCYVTESLRMEHPEVVTDRSA